MRCTKTNDKENKKPVVHQYLSSFVLKNWINGPLKQAFIIVPIPTTDQIPAPDAVQIHLNLHYIIRYITNKVCNVSDKYHIDNGTRTNAGSCLKEYNYITSWTFLPFSIYILDSKSVQGVTFQALHRLSHRMWSIHNSLIHLRNFLYGSIHFHKSYQGSIPVIWHGYTLIHSI